MSYQNADDPQLLADLRAALRQWPRAALGETALAARLPADPFRSRAEALRIRLRAALDRLRREGQAEEAALLERRYLRAQGVHRLCQTYHLSERSLYYRLKEATLALAHALWSEMQAEAFTGSTHLPPPTYSRLFGFERLLTKVLARLTAPDDHWLIGIEGLGGLGKTALAREAVARLTETDRFAARFAAIAWVTARQEFYTWRDLEQADRPALTFEGLLDAIADQWGLPPAARRERVRALLRERPCLVVVDNLETATEAETLPARLWELARPGKFLLTSRHRLGPGPGLSTLPLDELAPADALALLRYEGAQRGLQSLADAPDAALRPILAVAGGHPLALKLIVGQLVSLPLDRVLAALESARPDDDPLYRRLYRRSWDLLSGEARRLLLIMSLLPVSGGDWPDLAALSGLDEGTLAAAIGELTAHSLLQAGGLAEKTYTIHRLTHHFILGQAVERATFEAAALEFGEHYLAYARRRRRDRAALARRRDHLLQAMQLCADLGDAGRRITVELAQLLDAFMVRRGYGAAWRPYLERARQAAADLGDEAAQADLWNRLGALQTALGEPEVALSLHRRAAALFGRLGDGRNLARSLRLEGNAHYTRADLTAAQACYEQALGRAEQLPPLEVSYLYHNLANVHANRGEWPAALARYRRALDLLDPEEERPHLAITLNNMGLLHWQMGHWRRAVEDLLRALPLLRAEGDRLGQANAHHYLCRAYADLGEWEAALEHGRRALALRRELGLAEGLADLYTDLADVHLGWGEAEQAAEYLRRAEPLWRQAGGRRDGLLRLWTLWGDLRCQAGDWTKAQAAYEEALSLADPDTEPSRRLMAWLGLAQAHFQGDDARAARAALAQAKALAEGLDRPDLCIRLLWLRAELEPARRDHLLAQALALGQEERDNDRLAHLWRQTRPRLTDAAKAG